MAAWLQALIVLAGGGVIVSLVALAHKWTKQSGGDAYRADRAEVEAATTKKQTEILIKQETVEDVARDLDSGNF